MTSKKPAKSPVDLPVPTDDNNLDVMYGEVKDLFRNLIQEAQHILKAGTTQNKIALMRSVIPVLMKEMQAREQGADDEATKKALRDLFQGARADLDSSEPPKLADLPEDPDS